MISMYKLLEILCMDENIRIYDNNSNRLIYEGDVFSVRWSLCAYNVVSMQAEDDRLVILVEKD